MPFVPIRVRGGLSYLLFCDLRRRGHERRWGADFGLVV
jgi:hypothetical protein